MEDGRFREILACGRSLQPTAPEHEAHLCNSPCFCGQNSERAARFIVVAAAVVEGLPVLPWSGGHGTLFLRSLPAVKRPSCRVPPASEDSLLGMESMGSAQLALPLLVLQPRRCRAARPQHAIVTQMCAKEQHIVELSKATYCAAAMFSLPTSKLKSYHTSGWTQEVKPRREPKRRSSGVEHGRRLP